MDRRLGRHRSHRTSGESCERLALRSISRLLFGVRSTDPVLIRTTSGVFAAAGTIEWLESTGWCPHW
jgi:hypothetical protein